MNSKNFLRVLEVVLAIGNFLNYGSRSGNTVGFDVSILTKLPDTRANEDGNLLDFVITTLETQFPEAQAWTTELAPLKECKLASWEKVDTGTKELKAQTLLVKNLSKQVEIAGSNDHFSEIITKIEKFDQAFDSTKTNLDAMQKRWEEVAEKFAKDAAGMKPEEFFAELYEVVDKFDGAIREKKKRILALEKQKNKDRAQEEIRRLQISNAQKEANLRGNILKKTAVSARTESDEVEDKEAQESLNSMLSEITSASAPSSARGSARGTTNDALAAKVIEKDARSQLSRDERRKQLAEKRKELGRQTESNS